MSFDLLFRKYLYAVVGAFLALAAYFHAAGLAQLLGTRLEPSGAPSFPPMPAAPTLDLPRPRALPIHERNPFDHETPSLLAKQTEEAEAKRPVEVLDPLSVPACAGLTVHILTESDDPLWSFAAISGPGDKAPTLRRVGDKVGGQTVAFIGFNPASGAPTVWLEGDSLCQSALFGAAPPAPAAAAQSPGGAEEPASPKGSSVALEPDLAKKIRKISDTEFEIDRSAVDQILENQSALMRSARIVPEQKDGKVVGVRLFGIRPETLLGQLGLKNGDRLETINGFNMGSPEKALEAYARLRTANNLKITLNRRGAPTTIEMKIK